MKLLNILGLLAATMVATSEAITIKLIEEEETVPDEGADAVTPESFVTSLFEIAD